MAENTIAALAGAISETALELKSISENLRDIAGNSMTSAGWQTLVDEMETLKDLINTHNTSLGTAFTNEKARFTGVT